MLQPEVRQSSISVPPGHFAPARVDLSVPEVRPQSIRTDAEQKSQTSSGARQSFSLRHQQQGDPLAMTGRLPAAKTAKDQGALIRILEKAGKVLLLNGL